jgi:hypothetical protein
MSKVCKTPGRIGKRSRGQAAMEYLMTYGWAILIVLAIMGVLIYLVRPQKVESCNVGVPLQCEPEHYIIDRTGNLTIRLTNIGSVRYIIQNTTCANSTYTYPGANLSLSAGGGVDVYFNCSASPSLNPTATAGRDTFQQTVDITYYPADAPAFIKAQKIDVVVRYG